MAKKYKIILDRNTCIGVYACVEADNKYWIKSDDWKVDLKDAKLNPQTGMYEIILEEGQFNPEAEKVCPVVAIKIVEVDEQGNEIQK